MKTLKLTLLILVSFGMGELYQPKNVWITDANFEKKISGHSSYGDDNPVVVVEFWADFNKQNSFKEWNKLKGAKYYRADIKVNKVAKSKYRVRMAPTIIIFKRGERQASFKAGLDLILHANTQDVQKAINKVNNESRY